MLECGTHFIKGALFGLVMVCWVLCTVVAILSLVATINGLLTWIGHGSGIHQLPLRLLLRYVFLSHHFFPLCVACHSSTHLPPPHI